MSRWRIILLFTAVLLAIAVAGVVIDKMKAPSAGPAVPVPTVPTAPAAPSTSVEQPPTTPPAPSAGKMLTLAQIAARRKTWDVQFVEYFGRQAPDLRAQDLGGNTISLSNYRGRNVLVVFWAMWCGPCREEIPGLVKLRGAYPQDKLAIIAVSTDTMSDDPIANNTMRPELIDRLKQFAAEYKINYTVVTQPSHLDSPFARVQALPSAFFISPEGTVKFATAGLLPPDAIEAILAAEK
jgi:thiol-disulfide isomerase/thioredoxin